MNDHAEIEKLLPAFAGGDLAEQECRRIELHLVECPDCRAELANLQVVMRALRSTPEVEPPTWMTARIMAALKEQQAEKRNWLQRVFFPLHIKLPIEIMALLVVCVSGYYLSRNVESELRPPEMRLRQGEFPSPPMPIQEQYGSGKRGMSDVGGKVPHPAIPPVQDKAKAPALQAEPGAAPVPPSSRQESAPPAFMDDRGAVKSEMQDHPVENLREMKKAAKGGGADMSRPLSPSPARLSETSVGNAAAAAVIRMNVYGGQDAAGSIRSAALRSGSVILDQAEPQTRQIRIRIPARRAAELGERLAVIGKIIEMPVIPEHSSELELTIKW